MASNSVLSSWLLSWRLTGSCSAATFERRSDDLRATHTMPHSLIRVDQLKLIYSHTARLSLIAQVLFFFVSASSSSSSASSQPHRDGGQTGYSEVIEVIA